MDILSEIKHLKHLADVGLLYAENGFDRERYREVHEISLKLLSAFADLPLPAVKNFYSTVEDYPTPKVDVRALVLDGNRRVLLAQESADGRWSLPGGWADIGRTPSEVIEKEVFEETGLAVKAERLLAVFDKKCHPHPPEPHYAYKFLFGCSLGGGHLTKGFDMLDVAFFDLENLPPLSEVRILESQIRLAFEKWTTGDLLTYFD